MYPDTKNNQKKKKAGKTRHKKTKGTLQKQEGYSKIGFRENSHTSCCMPKIREKMHTWWISEGISGEGLAVRNINIKSSGQKTSNLDDN